MIVIVENGTYVIRFYDCLGAVSFFFGLYFGGQWFQERQIDTGLDAIVKAVANLCELCFGCSADQQHNYDDDYSLHTANILQNLHHTMRSFYDNFELL